MMRGSGRPDAAHTETGRKATDLASRRHNQSVCRILRNVGYPVPAGFINPAGYDLPDITVDNAG